MEDLIKTANLYYETSPPAVKDAAQKFFKEMDHDNDGKVCLQEFLGFMRDEGHAKMSSRHFFQTLDLNGSGTLEFKGVMALYYIIQSGRPFCFGCDDFIPGLYFTCSKCYQNSQNAICICPECFENGTYTHEHNNFLDNYALLEVKRMQEIATHSKQQHQVQPTSSGTSTELPGITTPHAVVPDNPCHLKKRRIAYKVLKQAVRAAGAINNWCAPLCPDCLSCSFP